METPYSTPRKFTCRAIGGFSCVVVLGVLAVIFEQGKSTPRREENQIPPCAAADAAEQIEMPEYLEIYYESAARACYAAGMTGQTQNTSSIKSLLLGLLGSEQTPSQGCLDEQAALLSCSIGRLPDCAESCSMDACHEDCKSCVTSGCGAASVSRLPYNCSEVSSPFIALPGKIEQTTKDSCASLYTRPAVAKTATQAGFLR
eukprot:TRINITY_DN1901_c0_g1_i1.p1 TRINITY_DN1901_c0_g1~~TRINITY_DN1901_c0_g1_i1.p1  ORF type:complete len:202 (-),score=21.90 TRINITY_DN1901_c0_g1_i1:1548-2153(-)